MANDWLKRLFTFERAKSGTPIQPGLYHVTQEEAGNIARFHLRVDNDGSGMLIANAMAAAQLTPTGVLIVKGLLEGEPPVDILRRLKSSFSGANEATMRTDIARMERLIKQLRSPGDTYPVFNLEDAAVSPYSAQLIAPLQASVPLAAPEILVPILDRLWDVSIPHVTFLAPQNPNQDELLRAVERAEDLGMIAGVRALAGDLYGGDLYRGDLHEDGNGAFLADLRQMGVDHITFPYAANDPEIHDAVYGAGDHAAARKLLDWLEEYQVSAIAEVPLLQSTVTVLEETVVALIERGADNLSFVAFATTDEALAEREGVFAADAMAQVATTVEEIASMTQARFMWSPPVKRDPSQPLMAQVIAGPRSAGDVAVRVEPDGRVIPPRGPYRSAGNLLQDPWETIWQDAVFRTYRERVEAPTRCEVCPGLAICAADCPRDPQGWASND